MVAIIVAMKMKRLELAKSIPGQILTQSCTSGHATALILMMTGDENPKLTDDQTQR